MERKSLSDQAVESLVTTMRVLADPTRIRLIEALQMGGGATAGSLAEAVPGSRQGVSHHLGILHRAAIVDRRRDGRSVRYELSDWTGAWLVHQLVGTLPDES